MTRVCLLPDGRHLTLDQGVADRLRCGVIELHEVRVDHGEGAALETEETAADLRLRYQGLVPSAIAPLAAARTLYKSFGMEPSRHRPSSEALLRRVLKGKDLYRINSAVDSCNLASLVFLLPVGMYDLDRIEGDVTVRVGAEGDAYAGIRKGPVNVGGRLALYDDRGPFGSPTSDSARTCVEDDTRRILAVVFAPSGYSLSDMQKNLEFFAALFGRHCAASTAFQSCLGWGSEP